MEHQQQILSLKGHDAITSNEGADALQAHHKAIELEKQLTEQKLQQRGRSSGKSTCRTVGV